MAFGEQLRSLLVFLRPWILAATALCFAACTSGSPTLPVPPPSALTSAPDADGFVTITGSNADPAALVNAYNEDLEIGVIGRPDADGNFTLRLRAESGHGISVWQTIGTSGSEIVSLAVP